MIIDSNNIFNEYSNAYHLILSIPSKILLYRGRNNAIKQEPGSIN